MTGSSKEKNLCGSAIVSSLLPFFLVSQMLLGSCHLHEDKFLFMIRNEGVWTWPRCWPVQLSLPYMKILHQLHSLFCWCNSHRSSAILKWPWTTLGRYMFWVMKSQQAVILLVHTQELAAYDLIKISKDFQFKKTYCGRWENIYIVICLLALWFFLSAR